MAALKKEKATPIRWLSLTTDQTRDARAFRREYKEIMERQEAIRENVQKALRKENERLAMLRQKASSIPGGLKRCIEDKKL